MRIHLKFAHGARGKRKESPTPASEAESARDRVGANPWRATLAAMCAVLAGIGLARFAYTPLVPALITAAWLSPAGAGYLGAGNLMGYLAGAVGARAIAALVPLPPLMRTMMVLIVLSFFACAAPWGFLWLLPWRVLAGAAGGVLMVLAAPAALPLVPAERRGLASGIVFTGVGLGISSSGLLMPALLKGGVAAAWLGLGAFALALTLAAWRGWPEARIDGIVTEARERSPRALKALYLEYGLNAVGLVPHMVFLADFVARGLGQGIAAGASQWVLYGLGAVAGPTVLGRIADRIGFTSALRISYAVECILIAAVAVVPVAPVLTVSSIVLGAYTPGITTIVLGRAAELTPAAPRRAWSIATIAWALGQAAGAYGLSAVFAASGSHALLFALGAAALAASLAINLAAGRI
jgi:predicted MFS family arabinose efflux permease